MDSRPALIPFPYRRFPSPYTPIPVSPLMDTNGMETGMDTNGMDSGRPGNRNAQSAGNLSSLSMEKSLGSSETIRGNTYDLFKKNFAYFFKQEFSVPDGQEDND